MLIGINHNTTISDIQQQFQKAFPYLKIEFADKPHKFGEVVKLCHWYDGGFTLAALAKNFHDDSIILLPWKRVGDVEEEFKAKFGLYPQIFRMEQNGWTQTAGTDVFNLDEQNVIAMQNFVKGYENVWMVR